MLKEIMNYRIVSFLVIVFLACVLLACADEERHDKQVSWVNGCTTDTDCEEMAYQWRLCQSERECEMSEKYEAGTFCPEPMDTEECEEEYEHGAKTEL
jgi:hypothetical protein